jgi:hypothetical protein
MSFRPGFRSFRNAFAGFRAANRNGFSSFGRRYQDAAAAAEKEKLNPFAWNSPVGPKTVHFWAPVMKWVLVAVSISDFTRPVDQLSLTQSGALMATGAIWTRWCLIIKPKNYLLAAVNFFLFLANGYQVTRIVTYNQDANNTTVGQELKGAAKNLEQGAEGLAAEAKAKAKGAIEAAK